MRNKPSIHVLAVIFALIFIVTGQTRAGMFDLTGEPDGLDEAQINGAWFYNVNYSATGSGTIDSFLRVGGGGSVDIEQGYNTDYRSKKDPKYPEFDEDKNDYNHSLLLSSIPNVDLFQNGTFYREFLLDINQNKSEEGRFLSLDKLEIYMGSSNLLYDYSTGFNGLGTKIYEMGTDVNDVPNWVLMDYSLNHGSGSGDLYVYIPDSLFVGGTYVYLYCMFGVHNPNTADYEEWAIRKESLLVPPPPPPPPVPVPAAALLGILGLAVSGIKLRKFV